MIGALGNTGTIRYTTTADMPAGEYRVCHDFWVTNLRVSVDGNVVASPYFVNLSAGRHVVELKMPTTSVPHDMFSVNGTQMDGYIDEIELVGPWKEIEYRAFIANSFRSLVIPGTVSRIGDNAITQNANLTRINGVTSGTLTAPHIKIWANENFNPYAALADGTIIGIWLPDVETWGGANGIQSAPMHSFKPDGGFDISIGPGLTTVYGGVIDRMYIKDIYIYATTPPTFVATEAQGGDALFFQSQFYGHLHVPTASVAAYKAAPGWSDLADKILSV